MTPPPSNCLHIASSQNVSFAGLATCCTTGGVNQPSPSVALTHPKLAGEDPGASHKHWNEMVRYEIKQLGLDFDGIYEITRDHWRWQLIVQLVVSMPLARDWWGWHGQDETHTHSFLICCIQCHLHLFPFFEPMWTFSWLFSFAAVTDSMYSGASAFLFPDENTAINPTAISSKVKKSTLLVLFVLMKSYNTKCRHSPCCYSQIQGNVLPCFDWDVADIVFHVQLIMTNYTIFVYVVQLNVLADLLDHIMTQPPVCVNNISWFWTCPDKSYNSIVLPNSGNKVWVAIMVWFISTPEHSTRFT